MVSVLFLYAAIHALFGLDGKLAVSLCRLHHEPCLNGDHWRKPTTNAEVLPPSWKGRGWGG